MILGLYDRNLGFTTGVYFGGMTPDYVVVTEPATHKIHAANPWIPGELVDESFTDTLAPGDVEVLYSAPPCAPYSKLVHASSPIGYDWMEDKLRQMANSLHVFETLRPEVYLLENLPDLITDTVRGLREKYIDYHWYEIHLELHRMDVPQLRHRAFIVGSRQPRNVENLSDYVYPLEKLPEYPTVGEMLRWLSADSRETNTSYHGRPGHMSILRYTPPNWKVRDAWYKLLGYGKNGDNKVPGPGLGHRRLDWDTPAPTMHGGIRFYHPVAPRNLYDHEIFACLGFPSMTAAPKRVAGAHFMAKGVSPVFGTAIASLITMFRPENGPEGIEFLIPKKVRRTLMPKPPYPEGWIGRLAGEKWAPGRWYEIESD